MWKYVQVQDEVKATILSTMPEKNQDHNLIWLILATGVGLILRLHFIPRDFWHDEAFQLLFSKMPIEFIFNSNDVHPPLFTLLTKGMVWFTSDPFFLRLVMLIISMMFAVAFYETIKEMFNQTIATYSYFFLMMSPTFAWYSTEFRSYIFVLLLTVIQIKHFNRMLDGNKDSGLWYILLSTAMLYSHYMTALILVTQILYIWILKGIKLWKYWAEYLLIILWSVTLLFYMLKTLPKIQSFWFKDINLLSYISSFFYLVNLPEYPLYNIITLIVFIAILSGLVLSHKRVDSRHIQLFLYIYIPISLMWIVSQFYPFYHHRYFLFGGVMLFALAGWGIYEITKISKVPHAIMFFIVILVCTLQFPYTTPINDSVRFLDNYTNGEPYSTIHTSPFSATPFNALSKDMTSSYILTQLTKAEVFTSGGAVIDYERQVYSNYSEIPKSENMFWVSDQILENHTIIYANDGLYIQELKIK